MRKNKHYNHRYPRYGFDRNFAIAWNDDCYHTWLIMDEGQERPDPQRFTNFLCKYGMKKRNILHYIPKEKRELIYQWIRMTKAERKEVFKCDKNTGNTINKWLHQAEADWYFTEKYNK